MNKQELQNLLVKSQEYSCLEWVLQNKIKNERGDPIEFKKHFFMIDIYDDWSPVQTVMKAAQIGFSTLAILKTLYAARFKRFNIIYTLPTQSDVNLFVAEKVNRMIQANPIIAEWVKDKDSVEQKQVGERFIYYRGTYTSKEAIMFSSDINAHDEEDRSNSEIVEQYASRLDYSTYKGQWHFSNPSFPNKGVDAVWRKSDQKHWFIKCHSCGNEQYLDWEKNVDKERKEYVCQRCHNILTEEDRRIGRWVRKWTNRDISGYWINQMMVCWKSAKELIAVEEGKGKQYFYNFVLGLPYVGIDVVVDRDLILRNLTTKESSRTQVCMGVDVGLEKHVVVGTPYGIFETFKTKNWEDIENVFLKYDATMVIDALPDLTVPRALMDKYKGRVFLNYFKEDTKSREDTLFKKDKQYGIVFTDRTRLIERAISMLAGGNIRFHSRSEDLDEYISHWSSMYRFEDKDRFNNPVIRWESANNQDHYVFATLYYLIALDRATSGEGAVFRDKGDRLHGRESFYVDSEGKIPAPTREEFVGKQPKDWRYI